MAAERGPGRRKPCPLRSALRKAARSPGPRDSRLDPSQKLVGHWASINLVSGVPSQLPPQESMESSQEDIAKARPTAAKLEQILHPEVPSAETFSCNPAPCPHLSLEHQAGQLGMLSGEYLQMCLSSMGESPLHSNLASALLPAVPSSDVPLLPASVPPSPRASCMGLCAIHHRQSPTPSQRQLEAWSQN
ncbi:uncharacterized protein LOC125625837 isoform X2 [Caretta caretta]|uniref:uncharacterized protein LOC125625837 isoform X2 n=1 Tax=Caretta caretta TaxID=8467 RepID=UPI003F4BDD4B